MKSILDPKFKYVPSNQTDLRQTFERVRREQELQRALDQKVAHLPERKPRNGSPD